MTYDNTNRGVLFKNNFRKNAADAEYNGSINTNGADHKIVATRKVSGARSKKPNTPFFAIVFVADVDVADDFESPNMVGSGVLFKNDSKNKDTHPDYRGSIETAQGHWWISAWINTTKPDSKNPDQKYLSLSCTAKDAVSPEGQSGGIDPVLAAKVAAGRNTTPEQARKIDVDFDDIPF